MKYDCERCLTKGSLICIDAWTETLESAGGKLTNGESKPGSAWSEKFYKMTCEKCTNISLVKELT